MPGKRKKQKHLQAEVERRGNSQIHTYSKSKLSSNVSLAFDFSGFPIIDQDFPKVFSHLFERRLLAHPGLLQVSDGGLKLSDIRDARFRCGHEVHYQDDTWHGVG